MKEVLKNCVLFKRLNEVDIDKILNEGKPRVKEYKKGEVIANQGDKCMGISVVIEGRAVIQNIYENGNLLTLASFKESDVFAEALIFSKDYEYPATVMAVTNCTIMSFSKESVLKVISLNTIFTENILGLLSEKIVLLNRKLNLVKLDTIRRKISKILLDYYKKTGSLTYKIASKKEMAEEIGIPRPSLSRELILMRDMGAIDFSLKEIVIKDLLMLEDELFN